MSGRPPRLDDPSDAVVRMRCHPAEKAAWESCAEHHEITLSEWMRMALSLQEARDARASLLRRRGRQPP